MTSQMAGERIPAAELTEPGLRLDGRSLDSRAVALLADGAARVVIDPRALDEVRDSWRRAGELVAAGRVYGRSTGVGANRTVDVDPADADLHGLRLLRSHAGGIGELLPARQVRAMLAIRLNQLLAGGSGLRPAVVGALAAALDAGVHPAVNEYGAVGTGDLSALSQLGLALAGEHPWHGGTAAPPALKLETGDALALISSNALTLGQAALAGHDLGRLLHASCVVTALSLLAVGGSHEAFAEPVHSARPHPGNVRAAAEIRRLIGAPARPAPPAGRIQDPYGLRCFPQVHGPVLEARDELERVLAVELNAAAENPLISPDGPGGGPAAYHHGGFYSGHLALVLDHVRLALLQTAQLSTARLAALVEPEITGLRPFLADEASAGSGVLILEYSMNAALAELRNTADPASLGHAVLSRGVEESASFASQAARQTLRAVAAYRLVLGCELVSAVRALRQRDARGGRGGGGAAWRDVSLPVGRAYSLADATLDRSMEDRPLTADVAVAATLLDQLADL
ncbi:aromatic amino acid ammonia-lyase [Streptosporangium sp. NPDC000396]|uniref:aromatic amino acid ammonia-lyase n=1 Tax=Streptosporangium sp. NPDC000396 TaxID=3366185 RepID=UPI0036C1E528